MMTEPNFEKACTAAWYPRKTLQNHYKKRMVGDYLKTRQQKKAVFFFFVTNSDILAQFPIFLRTI